MNIKLSINLSKIKIDNLFKLIYNHKAILTYNNMILLFNEFKTDFGTSKNLDEEAVPEPKLNYVT